MHGDDPLLERLRAADPAARDGGRSLPARERVDAARRRRSARRARRLGGVGALATLAAVVAATLAPGGESRLGRNGILLRAAEASALPRHAIVVIDSEFRLEGSGGYTARYTTWLRTSPGGRIAGYRQLVTGTSGRTPPPVGLDFTGPGDGNGKRQYDRVYNPKMGRTQSFATRSSFPSTAFAVEVHRLLVAARRNPRARIERHPGYVAYESRALLHRGVRFPGGLHLRREVRLDPKTYTPYFERSTERWRDHGKPGFTGSDERVIRRRTLPDTATNRRLLVLRGPTR
jgi:hypothetical protein